MSLFAPQSVSALPHVLMVCTGNICRSAYAEKRLADTLELRGNPFALTVASAGTQGLSKAPMDRTTASVAEARGLSTDHSSRPVDESIIAANGLILTMTGEHRQSVVSRDPTATHRTFTLAEFARCAAKVEWNQLRTATSLSTVLTAMRPMRSAVVLTKADDVVDPIHRPLEIHMRAADSIDAMIAGAARALAPAYG